MGKKHFSQEEHSLLKEFTKETKPSSTTGLYTAIGGITSLMPIYIYVFILHVDLESNGIILGAVAAGVAWMLSRSYEQVAEQQRPILEKKLAKAVADKMPVDKTLSKDKANEKIRRKTQSVADKQASAYAMFYNNAAFLAIVIFLTFIMFKNLSITVNYVLSTGAAAGLVLLHSS